MPAPPPPLRPPGCPARRPRGRRETVRCAPSRAPEVYGLRAYRADIAEGRAGLCRAGPGRRRPGCGLSTQRRRPSGRSPSRAAAPAVGSLCRRLNGSGADLGSRRPKRARRCGEPGPDGSSRRSRRRPRCRARRPTAGYPGDRVARDRRARRRDRPPERRRRSHAPTGRRPQRRRRPLTFCGARHVGADVRARSS